MGDGYTWRSALAAVAIAAASGCAHPIHGPIVPTRPEPLDDLWVEPGDLAGRDLFLGPGGPENVPESGATYILKKLDDAGHSEGFDVQDRSGRRWKVKVGEEAQSEIVTSRLLWAIGFHQPVLHYVETWHLEGGSKTDVGPGRFRLESDHENEGWWRWKDNPFVGTRELNGLLAVNLLLNNWDLNPSQNRVYRMKGSSDGPRRRFVVQDVGASLGKTGLFTGTRNDLDDFESQDFVDKTLTGGRVDLHYYGRHRALASRVTAADAAWACDLLSRLTEKQWDDAFRAGNYPADVRDRYIRKIHEKIAEGLEAGREERAAF